MAHRYGRSNLTFAYVQSQLSAAGMGFSRDADTGEYTVQYGAGWPDMDSTYRRATKYFTNDLADALATGLAMTKNI